MNFSLALTNSLDMRKKEQSLEKSRIKIRKNDKEVIDPSMCDKSVKNDGETLNSRREKSRGR